MKTVFLYAGQGSQHCGMGKDIYEQFPEYREVIDGISPEIKELMHEGTLEVLSLTENTQPCMAAFAAGVTNVLRTRGIVPDAACGLSLGEYGALHSAGVINAKDYVEITAFRGKSMAKAAEGHVCSMSAVLGMTADKVEAACEKAGESGFVKLVNYNCPGQYVICGDEEAVTKAEEILKSEGAKRCVRLNVSGPFHTKYMETAGKALREKLEEINFNEPDIPIVLNVTGDFYNGSNSLKDILERQIQNGVRFEESITKLLEAGADTFIEIGPGSALSGFVKKTAKACGKDAVTVSINTAEDLTKLLDKKEE